MENNVQAIYKAISNISNDLLTGISKGQKNVQQGFMFRGIDSVYNALAPALVTHGLLIIPRMTERTVTERVTKNGGVLFYVTVKAEFDFIAVSDGSKLTVSTYGEAMDSGDKATNKAMSIAYKYAAFQTFCIPTEDNSLDPDATTHKDVQPELPNDARQYIDSVHMLETMESIKSAWLVMNEKYAKNEYVMSHINDATNRRKKEITQPSEVKKDAA
ncbi:ERF family protein [Neisseriaceae bacterium CLB008]